MGNEGEGPWRICFQFKNGNAHDVNFWKKGTSLLFFHLIANRINFKKSENDAVSERKEYQLLLDDSMILYLLLGYSSLFLLHSFM
jgi:hypothetical protein